jgi:hypothetical protein
MCNRENLISNAKLAYALAGIDYYSGALPAKIFNRAWRGGQDTESEHYIAEVEADGMNLYLDFPGTRLPPRRASEGQFVQAA